MVQAELLNITVKKPRPTKQKKQQTTKTKKKQNHSGHPKLEPGN